MKRAGLDGVTSKLGGNEPASVEATASSADLNQVPDGCDVSRSVARAAR